MSGLVGQTDAGGSPRKTARLGWPNGRWTASRAPGLPRS